MLGNKAIEQKDYVKYLGVLIDSRLSFKQHLIEVNKKFSKTIGLMFKLRYYMNKKTLIMIYYGLIYPFLIYAVPIWGNSCSTFIDPIYKLQKKVVRLITFSNYTAHSDPLFNSLHILTIIDIYKIQTLKFVYACLKKSNPSQFHEYFLYSITNLNTQSSRNHLLNTPQPRTVTYGLKSIKYDGAILWNNLPSNIRNIVSPKQFIVKTKNLMLSLYI